MKQLLLVIDMQNGFLNDETEHIVPDVERLIAHFTKEKSLIAFTRFINSPDSVYVKWLGWSELMEEPETSLIVNFCRTTARVFDKKTYTAFTEDFESFLHENAINKIVICGVDTDACVLKTALDAFEKNYQPVVIVDACASGAGDQIHLASLSLLSRLIGEKQMVTMADIISMH